ncbi:MAG: hypothetical protein H7A43_05805 [Verrucomicrobia bacterium]|nr:hypothetical protein [Kiritimatiellia bacterium]MCP5488146.1 hypothetical protein [Verrucomicrobiota bacterium]
MSNRIMHQVATRWIAAIFAGVWGVVGLPAGAASIVVGPGINNGDFNDDVSATDSRNFSVTPSWWNLGTGAQTEEATRSNQDYDGTRNAVIYSNPSRRHALNTGHDIAQGDIFSVSYVWRDAFNFDDDQDRINVRLFVTDNNLIGGTQTTMENFYSGYSTADSTYEVFSGFYSKPVAGEFVGKRLFVAVEIDDGNGDGNDFARFDNLIVLANQTIAGTLIGPGVYNGDFNEDTSGDNSRSFGLTPSWQNIGTGYDQDAEATRNDSTYDGTRNAVLFSSPDRIHALNPGYEIQQYDTFMINYAWRDGQDFDDAQDEVEVTLYITDNGLIGGTPTELASFRSGLSTQNAAWQLASGTTDPASAAFDGENLFVRIHIYDPNGDANDFARLDNFTLVVNPNLVMIPAFGVVALVVLVSGLVGCGVWRLRHRSPVV